MIEIKLSVHQLVDFLLRSGDIDNRIYNKNTMLMGTKIHSYYQQKQNNEYLSEYPLSSILNVDDYQVTLFGRADGIIVSQDGKVTIDEIKSTVIDLKEFFKSQEKWHLGQAKCYAYMYAEEKHLDNIDVTLTYISQIDDSQMRKHYHYSFQELKVYVHELLNQYLDFYNIINSKKKIRNDSAEALVFPFKEFRKGQKELSKNCYGIATRGGVLFAEAPTGIGKTMSTLFPYVKSFAGGINDKIFYLTAKTTGREAAYKACELLKEKGFEGSQIVITAKDKICLNPGAGCNPLECPYAEDYYEKVRTVLTQLLVTKSSYDRDTIIEYAINNDVCPFELEMDLSLYTDVIICDYNYVFDPLVYMKRYFDEDSSSYLLLVDEAHNLVSRGKEMYSCSLSYALFKKVKKNLAKIEDKKIKSAINKLNRVLKSYLLLYNEDQENIIIPYLEDTVCVALTNFFKTCENIQKDFHDFVDQDFLDFFFSVNRLLKIYEVYSDNFRLYLSFKDEKTFDINLVCLDASCFIRQCLSQVRGATIFSATLSPLDYYMNELGGKEGDYRLTLDSPFPEENLLVMVQNNISTKYNKREMYYDQIVESIKALARSKVGNYFIYFPSYQFMNEIVTKFDTDEFALYVQEKDMLEKDKEAFLKHFRSNPKKTVLGFVVLGGTFAEGIDLIADRLIGACIVGVGLPQLNFKSDLVKEYFENHGLNGFNYAYVNRAINNVMQALGRVIRSENDKGVVLLMDERYMYSNYKKIFRGNLKHYHVIGGKNDIELLTTKFWNYHNMK